MTPLQKIIGAGIGVVDQMTDGAAITSPFSAGESELREWPEDCPDCNSSKATE